MPTSCATPEKANREHTFDVSRWVGSTWRGAPLWSFHRSQAQRRPAGELPLAQLLLPRFGGVLDLACLGPLVGTASLFRRRYLPAYARRTTAHLLPRLLPRT